MCIYIRAFLFQVVLLDRDSCTLKLKKEARQVPRLFWTHCVPWVLDTCRLSSRSRFRNLYQTFPTFLLAAVVFSKRSRGMFWRFQSALTSQPLLRTKLLHDKEVLEHADRHKITRKYNSTKHHTGSFILRATYSNSREKIIMVKLRTKIVY